MDKQEQPKIQVVIPSRRRSAFVAKAAALFRDPIICVDETEVDDYRRAVPQLKLLAHPKSVNILQTIRQWILDNVKADVIFQCDDDVHDFYCMVGYRVRRLADPAAIEAIITNAAHNCRDAGTLLFFFAHTRNPVDHRTTAPIRFVSPPVGCAMGIWRQEFNRNIRFDPGIQHAGLDAALRIMANPKYRIIWCDTRFCFQPKAHLTAIGGLAGLRTAEGIAADDDLLRKRFGSAISIEHYKRTKGKLGTKTVHIRLHVDR
jgi:hypothetical protein